MNWKIIIYIIVLVLSTWFLTKFVKAHKENNTHDMIFYGLCILILIA